MTPSVRTIESLGKVTYEIKPNTSNVVAGFILGFGLFVSGLALSGLNIRQVFFAAVASQEDRMTAVIPVIFGIGMSIGGVMLIRFSRSLMGFRLRVCADGFWFTRRKHQFVFAWDEIVRVTETVVHEKTPLVKGPARHLTPTKIARSYNVIRCDGESFHFNENIIPRTSMLAGPLSAAAKARNVPWTTDEKRT